MKIIEKGPTQRVGIKIEARWQALFERVPETWKQFYEQADRIPYQSGSGFTDASLSIHGDRHPQLIGTEVSHFVDPPEGFELVTLPAGRYIHHAHTGSFAAIADTFGRMLQWAEAGQLIPADLKLDVGYTEDEREPIQHELFVGLQL